MFTVGEMKRHLEGCDDNDELAFPGGLTFYRLKRRGSDLICLEVAEVEAPLSDELKKKFPEVKVAFCSFETTGELIQEVSVPVL